MGTRLMDSSVSADILGASGGAEERFRLLVESVKDYAIFMLDPSGHVASWNEGAQRIKGYSAAQIIGRHFSVFYPQNPETAAKCAGELEIAVREGRFEEEGWRLRQDGSKLWANVTITPLFDPRGELLGFAKVTRDLTARRDAEASLRSIAAQQAALAEQARIQQFQERFLAILGHDLRNPLASIDMGIGILKQQGAGETAQRVLERMSSSSARMTRMIEQILELTRSRLGGGLTIQPIPSHLDAVLSGVVDELRVAYPTNDIQLESPQIAGTWDPDRLEQVFSNLVGNAILHGAPGTPVTIHAGVEGEQCRVVVHNQGPPIPPDIQGSLFNPFRRGERDSRTAKTAGLGLGLYISQELVQAHGGQIEVRSNADEGTQFCVRLPVHAPFQKT
ncbi:MAG: PAS domain-containing sensor histidine kinase [Myxococcales bacterium]